MTIAAARLGENRIQSSHASHPANSEVERLDAVVISDIHLGSSNCQASAVVDLLERIRDGCIPAGMLIINGDVFDSIDFRRLKKRHWKVLSLLRRLSNRIEVIWIAGNHDGPAKIISHLLGVRVVDRYFLESGARRILILHGQQFDKFIENHPVLTWIADGLYAALQKIDRTHYIARQAKRQSKMFLRCERKVRDAAVTLARQLACQIAICGHTHHAAAETSEPIEYYNSGCWTEKPCHYLTVRGGEVNLMNLETA